MRNTKFLSVLTWLLVFLLAFPIDQAAAQSKAKREAVTYVQKASSECRRHEIRYSAQRFENFKDCLNEYRLTRDPLPESTLFRFRHGKTGLYLRSPSGGSIRAMAKGAGDVWLWDGKNTVLNMRSGYSLKASGNGVSLAIAENGKTEDFLWKNTLSRFAYNSWVKFRHSGKNRVLHVAPNKSLQLVADTGLSEHAWVMEKAPPADLAIIKLQKTKAWVTSTGQDENTAIALMAIELAIDVATIAGSGGGAGLGLKAGVGAAKAGGKAGFKAAAKKIGKEVSEALANRALRKTVGGAQKLAAKKAMQKMAKAKAKEAALKAPKRSLLGSARKYIGKEFKKAGGKQLVKDTAKEYAIKQALHNSFNQAFKLANGGKTMAQVAAGINDPEQRATIEEIQNEEFEQFVAIMTEKPRFPVVENIDEVIEKVQNAEGRKGDEGLIQGLLSPVIDDTRDELYINVNGLRIYGGSRGTNIEKGDEATINKSRIFDRTKGAKIAFYEWDDHSSDDWLGGLDVNTETLRGNESYTDALVYDTDEGSLYQLWFSVSPLKAIFEDGARADYEYGLRFISEVNAEISKQIKLEEKALEARRKAERERRVKDMETSANNSGAKNARRFKALVAWRKEYEAQCRQQEEAAKTGENQPLSQGHLVPGTWKAGNLTNALERDESKTWEYSFNSYSWGGGKGWATGPGMHKFGGHWSLASGVHHPHYDLVRKSLSNNMRKVNQYYSTRRRCDGIFLMREPEFRDDKYAEHFEPRTYRLIKGTNQTSTRMKGIEDDAKQHETMLPIFRKKKSWVLEAYATNFLGEPVIWLQKTKKEDIPHKYSICAKGSDPIKERYRNRKNLSENVLIGVWEGEASCGSKKIKSRLTFTPDGAVLGTLPAQGKREKARSISYAWRADQCRVNLFDFDRKARKLSKAPDARADFHAYYVGNDWTLDFSTGGRWGGGCTFRGKKVKNEVDLAKLSIGDQVRYREFDTKWNNSVIRDTDKFSREFIAALGWASSIRVRAGNQYSSANRVLWSNAYKKHEYVRGGSVDWTSLATRKEYAKKWTGGLEAKKKALEEKFKARDKALSLTQVKNGCRDLGRKITEFHTNKSWHSAVDITVTNDSLGPWKVYWVDAQGDTSSGHYFKETYKPVAEIAPGATTKIDAKEGYWYLISGSGPEYGETGCVGMVTGKYKQPLKFTSNGLDAQRLARDEAAKKARAAAALAEKTRSDRASMQLQIARLTQRWEKGQCGPGGVIAEKELLGMWDAGKFDSAGLKEHAKKFRAFRWGTVANEWMVEKNYPHYDLELNTNPESAKIDRISHCTMELDGFGPPKLKLKFFVRPDKRIEFFSQVGNTGDLLWWGVKRLDVGPVSDVDPAVNTVSENAKPGTPIGVKAFATDPDKQDKVKYTGAHPFGIDETTGEVVVKHPLDREENETLNVSLTAESSDTSTSTVNVVVKLEDFDEFDITPLKTFSDVYELKTYTDRWGSTTRLRRTSQSKDQETHIAFESQDPGKSDILTAFAEDKDATATVRYSLSDDAGGRFVIDPVKGKLTNAVNLDYEKAKSHSVEVVATSSDGSKSRKRANIVVKNVNDAKIGLVKDIDPAPNAVLEQSPFGTPVGITLNATDEDTGDKVTYRYSRCVGCRNYYKIDPETGVVTTGAGFEHQIDLEDVGRDPYASGKISDASSISILAQSTDGSESSQTFQIEILDANEHKIEGTSDKDRAGNLVPENATPGTKVGITANANDPDAKATVSYRLSDNASGRFAINAETGVVTLVGKLDFEDLFKHKITVVSTSNDGSTSTKDFDIFVTNIEEFNVGPVSDVDNAPNTVPEGTWAAIGIRPVGITALAKDGDAKSSVTYSLKGGRLMDQHNFGRQDQSFIDEHISIDVKSGVVSAWSGPDFETNPTISFTVIATSNDGSTSEAQFVVNVTNVNDNRIGDLKDLNSAPDQVAENTPIGSPVGITARASDGDASDTISYSITRQAVDSSGKPLFFAVDKRTGVVTVAGKLDAEVKQDHYFTIHATSSDGSKTDENFRVSVTDVNEFGVSEVTDRNGRPNEVDEDAEVGALVGISADATEDISDKISYRLTSNPGRHFAIDPQNGIVTLARPLSDEILSHTIEVTATSTDGSTNRSSFAIDVNAVNDGPISAVSDVDRQPNRVLENAPAGTPVGVTLLASDRDATDTVTYRFDNFNRDFDIDPATGVVTVGRPLDHEQASSHTLEIRATSSDRTSSQTTIEIAVVDVNDNGVRFIQDTDPASSKIREDAGFGTPVGITAFAEDLDPGDTVTYSLSDNASGRFAIDPQTGVVTVAGALDFETADWGYRIGVIATSSDGSTSQNSLSQTISLIDVNEFAVTSLVDIDTNPNQVREKDVQGTPIGITASAKDHDATNNRVFYRIFDRNGTELDWHNGAFRIDGDGIVTTTNVSKLDVDGVNTQTSVRIVATSQDQSTSEQWFDVSVVYAPKWLNNPRGPRVDSDFPTVPDVDRQACLNENSNWKNQASFNNEVAYFDCVKAAVPPIVFWRDNPQDPRAFDPNRYNGIPHEPQLACVIANDDQNSPSFNNETEFWDCLDRVMDSVRPTDNGSGGGSNLQAQINQCAATHDAFFETPTDRDALMTVTNNGTTTLNAFLVTDPKVATGGDAFPVATIAPGQSMEFNAKRKSVFAVLGQGNTCVGAIKAWESRNARSFAQSPDTITGPITTNDGGGNAPGTGQQQDGQQQDGQEPGWNRAEVFYQPAFDHCAGVLGLDENGRDYEDCYYAFPNYQSTQQPSNDNNQQPDGQQPDGQQPGGQQPGGQEPGWNRAEVFYQPAFDHCAGVLGLDQSSQEYETCYYAYPNYQGTQQPSNDNNQQDGQQPGGQQPDGQEPGWNRDVVFYQPAYDHCNGVLGYELNTPMYEECYYAYPNFDGNQQSGGQEQGPDLNPGGAYSQLPDDVLQSCQGDISCLDAAVLQANRADAQGIENQISSSYPDLDYNDISRCEGHTYGSNEFFGCLDQVNAEKQQYQEQSDGNQDQYNNDNQQSDGGQKPGWNRSEVFYQPAYDHCNGQLGLELNTPPYEECYYAYPNYEGNSQPNNDNEPQYEDSEPDTQDNQDQFGDDQQYDDNQDQQYDDNQNQYDDSQDYDSNQQQSDEGGQSGEQAPGWNRDVVFYQPAYDHCNGELGYELNTPTYEECYYAFGN